MSLRHVSPPHPIIILSDSDVENTFSSTHSPNYIPASLDYFPASPGNTSPNFSDDLTKDLLASLALSPFYNDQYMKVMQAYDATDNELPIPSQAPTAPPTILPPSPISPPKDTETPVKSPIPISPSSSVRSSSPVRSTTPPPDYPFDKSIFAELDNSLWIIPQPLGSEPVPEKPNESDTCLEYSSLEAVIRQLVVDSVAAALEAQAATIASTDNPNRNTGPRETHVARKCTYKEFMSCQPFYFNGTERAWNSYAKPIGIEQADKIAWTELKRLLTNKYYPRTEVKKMEDEFYNLVVKGNDLKIYARRLQELAILCLNMVPNTEKLIEAFIGGLPRSIEGNVTALKPKTLEEAITITQRLMDQVTKHGAEQRTNDHKRKFDDRRNDKNNYPNNRDNNNYPNDQNNNN
ncbi:reverse transcriptase domain-containing protein [Tanacetum coccineum]